MLWLRERSDSLLLLIIMHASLVATQLVLVAPCILVWAALLWTAAGPHPARGEAAP